MTIQVGDTLPATTVLNQIGDDVKEINLAEFARGRRIVLVGMPGAYTSICSGAHLPSFIRTAPAFRDKGIDDIAIITVNDVRVTQHWGETTGAQDAGILMLADWDGEFSRAAGLDFTVPAIGFKDRITRCAMVVDDGKVTVLRFEDDNGACDLTAGESLLEMI